MVRARYIRWTITRRKDIEANLSILHASLFQLTREGTRINWPSNATATNPGGSSSETSGPGNLVDNSLTTTWVDYFVNATPGLSGPVTGRSIIVIDAGTAIEFNGYQWGTGDQNAGGDPLSWTVEFSDDGINWTIASSVSELVPNLRLVRTRNFYITQRTTTTVAPGISTTTAAPQATVSPGTSSPESAISPDGLVEFSRRQFIKDYRKGSGDAIASDTFFVRNRSNEIPVTLTFQTSPAITINPAIFTLSPGQRRDVTAQYSRISIDGLPLGVTRVGLNVRVTSETAVVPGTPTTTAAPTLPPPPPPTLSPTTAAPGESTTVPPGTPTTAGPVVNPCDTRPQPGTPTTMRITSSTNNSLTMDWSPVDTRQDRFELQVSINGGPWQGLANINSAIFSYTHTGLTAGISYSYRVRACNACGCSAWSGVATRSIITTTTTVAVCYNQTVTMTRSARTATNSLGEPDTLAIQGQCSDPGPFDLYYVDSNNRVYHDSSCQRLVNGGLAQPVAFGTGTGQYYLVASGIISGPFACSSVTAPTTQAPTTQAPTTPTTQAPTGGGGTGPAPDTGDIDDLDTIDDDGSARIDEDPFGSGFGY